MELAHNNGVDVHQLNLGNQEEVLQKQYDQPEGVPLKNSDGTDMEAGGYNLQHTGTKCFSNKCLRNFSIGLGILSLSLFAYGTAITYHYYTKSCDSSETPIDRSLHVQPGSSFYELIDQFYTVASSVSGNISSVMLNVIADGKTIISANLSDFRQALNNSGCEAIKNFLVGNDLSIDNSITLDSGSGSMNASSDETFLDMTS